MANIIITENQLGIFMKLLEDDSLMLNSGNVKEYDDEEEIGTSATITDSEGNPKPGKDVYSDEIGKFTAYQGWNGCPRGRYW